MQIITLGLPSLNPLKMNQLLSNHGQRLIMSNLAAAELNEDKMLRREYKSRQAAAQSFGFQQQLLILGNKDSFHTDNAEC